MRRLIAALLCTAAAAALAQPTAGDYPNRAVRVVVCFPVGSAPDIVARQLGEKLARQWKQGVVVDNRVGADCMIANDAVAKAAPDGYTLYLATMGALALNPSIIDKLPYDPLAAFAGITFVADNPFAILLRSDMAVRSVLELAQLSRTRSGGLNYGSAGTLGPLIGSVFRKSIDAPLTLVPYKGVQPALVDLLGAQIDLVIGDLPSLLPPHRQGRARLLVVTSARRAPLAPEVPTMTESGYRDFDFSTWYALVAPGATPRAVIERVNGDAVGALQSSELRQQLLTLGMQAQPSRPETVDALIRSDIAKWAALVRESK